MKKWLKEKKAPLHIIGIPTAAVTALLIIIAIILGFSFKGGAEPMAAKAGLLIFFGILIILCVFASCYLAYRWYCRKVKIPAQNLNKVLPQLIRGDYSAKIKQEGYGEIRKLAKNLKSLGDSLKTRDKKIVEEMKEKYRETLTWDGSLTEQRPDGGLALRAFREAAAELETRVKEEDPEAYKLGLKEIKAGYLKNILPEIYNKEIEKPVKNTVIFMESGNSPSPSSAYLAKVIQKQGKYKVRKTGLKVRQVPEVTFYENACNFVKELGTSKAVFLSTANSILSHIDVRPETKVIQLWHGAGVFKKVGYSTVDNKNFGMNKEEREEYDQYKNYSYVTIPSMEQAWIFEDAMHIPQDSGVLVPVGVSRTDLFYDPDYAKNALKKLHKHFPKTENKKIILYAPTFRGKVASGKAPDRLDVNAFAEALNDEYVLLIKHHGLAKDIPPIPEPWENTFAYDLMQFKVLGIDELLAIADICITDYSSIAFEYAIMERPLIFFAYDLEDYIDKRGMYYDYEDITPGPVCKTNEEMIDYIKNIDSRFDKQEVIDFKNKYVTMCDGHATERTIALLDT